MTLSHLKPILFLLWLQGAWVLSEYCSSIQAGAKCFISESRICPDGRKFIWKSIPICDLNVEICCLPTLGSNSTGRPDTTALTLLEPTTEQPLNISTGPTMQHQTESPLLCGLTAASILPRMIGGQYLQSDCQWPWLVMIRYDVGDGKGMQQLGTGALISGDIVVTNGNSIKSLIDLKDFFPHLLFEVKVGAHDLRLEGRTEEVIPVNVNDIVVHEDFRDNSLGTSYIINDIALLRLQRNITPSVCRYPVCLPEKESEVYEDRNCKLVGWGQLIPSQNRPQPKPLTADVLYIDSYICSKMSDVLTLPPGTSCAITHENKGVKTCALDKGNLIMCPGEDGRWILRGLVSVSNCHNAETPFILTDFEFHNTWIQSKRKAWQQAV